MIFFHKIQKTIMEQKYKNKPSIELIDKYIKTIEHFLSAHNIKIKINLLNEPHLITSLENGVVFEEVYHWFDDVFAVMPSGQEVKVELFSEGIDGDTSDHDIWIDAHKIQEQIYKELDMEQKLDDKNDPYWKLWEFLKDLK